MRASEITEQQIVATVCQAAGGTPVVEVYGKLGITEQTFYRWMPTCASMEVADLRRLNQVKEEDCGHT